MAPSDQLKQKEKESLPFPNAEETKEVENVSSSASVEEKEDQTSPSNPATASEKEVKEEEEEESITKAMPGYLGGAYNGYVPLKPFRKKELNR